jgi:heme oxygenase
MIADNSEVASIFRRGVDSKELDRDEITRFEALMEVYFTSLEDMDHQYKSDLYFDEDDDEDLVRFMAPAYRDMLMCTYGSNWWDRTAKARCTPSFYDKIQQIRMAWSAEKN